MFHRFPPAALAVLGCALCVIATPAGAFWIGGGVPICTVPYDQEDLVICSDGAGGAVIAWEGPHDTPEWDIFCQRLDARGKPLWTADGAPVCEAPSAQTMTAIAPDGTGGAFLCWTDNRDGQWDVYAQRIGANGSPVWAADGIPIARLDREQSNNRIVPDGAGGAIIAWHSYYDESSWDIMAQRVAPDGNILWDSNGTAVGRTAEAQIFPQMIPDGSGGAIVVWEDGRAVVANHIYAQRIDASGDTLWAGGGVPVCAAALGQTIPHVVSDGAGGAIVTWYDYRNGWADIYAQRLNAAGAALWTPDGVAVCNAQREQYNPRIASDGAGGAIIAWYDYRSQTNYDIYAQRIGAAGTPLWTEDGVAVCTLAGDQTNPRIAADGSGGALIVWNSPGNARAQRLDATGAPLWTPDGLVVSPGGSATRNADLLSRGADGAILAWEDYRSGESWDVYAALFDGSGALVGTLLAGWDAAFRDGAIALGWDLTEPVPCDRFTVLRREAAGRGAAWEVLPLAIEARGLSYCAADLSCRPGARYVYRVDMIEDAGARTLFETDAVSMPALDLVLNQNRPNPFNPSTTISFSLPRVTPVTLEIFDGAGRTVARLLAGERLPAGAHEVAWHGRDAAGRSCAAGVYFYRLAAGKETLSRKMVLVR